MMRALRWVGRITLGAIVLVALALAVFRASAYVRERATREALLPEASRVVRAGDVDMALQEDGPPMGRIVVLVHGTGAWSESWRDTIDALARAGYRVIAV